MKRMRNLLVGVLLVALAVGFTGGLRGINTATQASELDFCKLLSMIAPATVYIRAETADPNVISTGSGFIIDRDNGYIITNWHVVDEAVLLNKSITVFLPQRVDPDGLCAGGGDIYLVAQGGASVVRANPPHDLVLLSIGGTNRQVWLGNSARVNLGDNVFIIGYPAPLSTHPVCYGPTGQIVPCAGQVAAIDRALTITQEQVADMYEKVEVYEAISIGQQNFALIREPSDGGRIPVRPFVIKLGDLLSPELLAALELNPEMLAGVFRTISQEAKEFNVIKSMPATDDEGNVVGVWTKVIAQWETKAFALDKAISVSGTETELHLLDPEILQVEEPGIGDYLKYLRLRLVILDSVTVQKIEPTPDEAAEVAYGVSTIERGFLSTRDAQASGNSGGPMFNSWGQVIGVTTLTVTAGWDSNNITSTITGAQAELQITSQTVMEALKLGELGIRMVGP